MIRAFLILVLMASAATAQTQDTAPKIEVSLDPDEPVTVGTPVKVSVTVLVPTYMPDPPLWPDLQIADAITRLPDRATTSISRRIDRENWSGVQRTFEITPQTAADFRLDGAVITVTFADPDSSDPRKVDLAVPDFTISAVLPQGAEGLDPFIAAQELTLTASVDGLPDKPKPGDAFTLTLTTTASGTTAMLLPPIGDRLPTPPGLRAYPRQPDLSDTPARGDDMPTATRTEEISFVIEAPGSYTLPGLNLEWWNLGNAAVETSASDPITFDVRDTLGHEAVQSLRSGNPFVLLAVTLAAIAILAAVWLLWRISRHRTSRTGPSERALFHELTRAVARGPVQAIRPSLRRWVSATQASDPTMLGAEIETTLKRLERAAFGPTPRAAEKTERDRLASALSDARRSLGATVDRGTPGLPDLNPSWNMSR